tara:strand:+ start:1019 stop:2983 length:1965 start_codon:yes stop_codon:yes gene_type:complete
MNVVDSKEKNEPSKEEIKLILDLFKLNKLEEANRKVDNILIKYPKSSILFNILGAILSEQNKLEKAVEKYNESIKNNPNYFQAYNNLGVCLYKKGEIREAIYNYHKAIKIKPNHSDSHNNLGIAFKEIGEYENSINSFKKAIEVDENHADAHNNLGTIYKQIKEYKQSIYHYEKAISIKPNSPATYSNLGNLYKAMGKYEKAISLHKKAMQVDEGYADAYYNLGTLFEKLNNFIDATKNYEKAIEIQPDHAGANSNLLFNLCWSENNTNYLKIAENYSNAIKILNKKNLIPTNKSVEKKLNIGFVSGDFRNHSVSFFLMDTLKYLKNKNLQLIAYSNNIFEDNITKLIKRYFNKWNLVVHKTDKELVDLIGKDNIDVLVDLSGHTAYNRLSIFKNRCAPTQISWCGWLASTGIKEIDYIIGDKYVTPLSNQKKFCEKIYQMKNIWQTFSPSLFEASTPTLKKNDNKHIIFGSFVNNAKINDSVINTWGKILDQIPSSKLFLKCTSFDIPEAKENFIKRLKNRIKEKQLIIEGKSSRADYLDNYNKIDIVLDTFPASGGLTSFDASYMGVPVLTKINNDTFWFRSGESINKNLKMDEWIAKDESEYIQKALKFSEDKKSLFVLKNELRNITLKSSLFDPKKYSNDFYEMLLNVKR